MERVSHREYLLWQAHFELEWNRPSRTDYYLMQLSALQSSKKRPTLKTFKLQFNTSKPKSAITASERRRQAKAAQAVWLARLGATKKNANG